MSLLLLFRPETTGGGVTGTLAATESGNDTFAASGTVLIEGALAATETGNDTFSASGKVLIQGSLAATETGNDTFAAVGVVSATGVTGTMAATETGDDTFAATGEVISPAVFVPTKGGIPKAKTKIKKSEHEDIAAIVKREFDILDGTYQPEIVEQVKEEILPQIKQIDYSQYEIAVNQVNALISQAKARVAQYEAKLIQDELDDEEALLMLL